MSAAAEGWQPVLTGPDAERAAGFISETVARLVVTAPSGEESGETAFLANGALGKALVCDEAARTGLVPEAAEAAETYVRRCLTVVRTQPAPLGLYGGSTGLLWFLARRPAGTGRAGQHDGGLEQAAELLAGWLRSEQSRTSPYDLISGVAGFAVAGAALARSGQTTALARAAAAWLVATQVPGAPGTWLTRPQHAAHVDNPAGAPLLNLGVAHGVPGALGALALIADAGVDDGAAAEALHCGVQRLTSMAASRRPGQPVYPYWMIGEQPSGLPSRAAWCYGDPGAAAVLHRCAGQQGSFAGGGPDVLRRIAAAGLQRSPAAAEVADAGLCHGAAGLAHIANRLFQATGDDVFRNAARRWYDVARALVTGDRSQPARTGPGTRPPSGYLTGTAGVALVFSALIGSEPPWWDEVLLL